MPVQLSPSYLRRSFQLLGKLSTEKMSQEEAFERSSDIVYSWARKKFCGIFKSMNYTKGSFESKKNGNELGIIYKKENMLFVLRGVHPDSNIAGRMWITDVQISCNSSQCVFAVRLSVSSLQNCEDNVPFSRPRFIIDVLKEIGIYDICEIRRDAHTIETEEDVDEFIYLLENKNRQIPVVLITPCYWPREGVYEGYMMDPLEVAEKLSGIAHVFQISQVANENFTHKIGRAWSAFGGAIRTYYPDLSLEGEEYYKHPLIIRNKIIKNQNGEDSERNNFCMYGLVEHIRNYVLRRQFPWKDWSVEFYLNLYQEELKEQRKKGAKSQQQLVISFEEQLKQLQQQCDENLSLADSYAKDCERLQNEREEQKQLITCLKAKIYSLKQRLKVSEDAEEESCLPVNGTYDEMSEWVKSNFPDRLVLHNRAIHSLKNACYEDVPLVYKCLELLATSYYDYRIGEITYEEFTAECQKVDSSLNESGAITDVAAGMQGDTYYVVYHGKKHKLERHLTKGSNKDQRYCLRIYFFWDEDEQMVVVGDLPRHLETSAT